MKVIKLQGWREYHALTEAIAAFGQVLEKAHQERFALRKINIKTNEHGSLFAYDEDNGANPDTAYFAIYVPEIEDDTN